MSENVESIKWFGASFIWYRLNVNLQLGPHDTDLICADVCTYEYACAEKKNVLLETIIVQRNKYIVFQNEIFVSYSSSELALRMMTKNIRWYLVKPEIGLPDKKFGNYRFFRNLLSIEQRNVSLIVKKLGNLMFILRILQIFLHVIELVNHWPSFIWVSLFENMVRKLINLVLFYESISVNNYYLPCASAVKLSSRSQYFRSSIKDILL